MHGGYVNRYEFFSVPPLSAVDQPYHRDNKDYGNDDSGDQARFAQPPKFLGGSYISYKARFYPAWQCNHNLIYPRNINL